MKATNGEKLTLTVICLFFMFVVYQMLTPNSYRIEYEVSTTDGIFVESGDTIINGYSPSSVCSKVRSVYSDAFKLEMRVTCVNRGGYDRIVRQ